MIFTDVCEQAYKYAQVVWVRDPRDTHRLLGLMEPGCPSRSAPGSSGTELPHLSRRFLSQGSACSTGQMLSPGLSGHAAHQDHTVPTVLPPPAQGHVSQASQALLHQPGAVGTCPGGYTESGAEGFTAVSHWSPTLEFPQSPAASPVSHCKLN